MAALSLNVWFHPSMNLPVALKPRAFTVPANLYVADLMDICEEYFEGATAAAGSPLELQINVLWNTKDHKKALGQNQKLAAHFESGDTFGVYGDVQPFVPRPAPKLEEDKVPVTILTGFLGSGKTTLLNYILQEQREKKIAIIENEFGEISIDDALLSQEKLSLAEKIVVMDNGCMCCTIRGDLERGLLEIVQDIKKGGQIDAIMIETTGMADPVPIVRTFMASPAITQDLRLDAVIAMADAKHLPGRLDDEVEKDKVNEAYQQIAFADKIILNKLDLITTEEAIAVKDRIREINRFAKVLPAIKGRVRMEELTNIRAHDMVNFVNEDIEKEADTQITAEMGGHGDGHGHDEAHGDAGHGGHGGGHNDGHDSGHSMGHTSGHEGHGPSHGQGHAMGHGHGSGGKGSRHDGRVNSFAIVKEGEINPRKLAIWMQTIGMLPPDQGTIFRIKAILAIKGYPFKHVFHAVMDVSDEDDAAPWAEGEKRICKIVFIGKALDEPYLRKSFEALFE